MAKAPFPGEVKTRLAATIGPDLAAGVHRAFLAQTIATAQAVVAPSRGAVAVMAPDARHAEALTTEVPDDVQVWQQDRPGLMAGITQAFGQAFEHGAEVVLVSASDSPNLPAGHLLAAFDVLGGQGAIALGSCEDGGYYAIGAPRLDLPVLRALLEGQTYDGTTICRETAARAQRLGLATHFAPAWYDVDSGAELRRLRADLALAGPVELARRLRHLLPDALHA